MRTMKKHYLRKRNSIVLLLCIFLLTGCQIETIDSGVVTTEDIKKAITVTRFDRDVLWEEGEEINLSEESNECVITDGGSYRITGQTTNGLVVDTEDQNVHLFLENTIINTTSGPAIWIRSAGKVVITLVRGTHNILSDYPSLNEKENVDAALFCVSDLTINGDGALEVSGYHKDAIYSKDVLKILGGDIIVRTKGDGIRGSDGVVLSPHTMSIESEHNGIITKNTGKTGKGCIEICGGDIEIVAGEYGIKSAADLYIENTDMACQGIIGERLVEGREYIK